MYKVQLNNFEGPIDLLLYFIRRDELDIYDIPISEITREFVRTVEEWKKMHLHVCLLYTSPSPRDATLYRMPSSA